MNSSFTSRLATIMLTIACTTTSVLAQSPRKTTPVKRTTSAAHPSAVKSTRPVQTSKPAVSVAAAPVSAPQTQPAAAPAPERSQPVAVSTQRTSTQPTAYSRNRSYRSSSSGSHTKYLNLGLGLATYYGGGLPVGASFEVDVKNNFSIGGSFDLLHYSYGYYSGGYNYMFFGARGSYHLGDALGVQDNKFDPYIGATLGFRYTGNSYSDYYYYSGYNNGLYLGIHLGARYMLSDHVGLYSEIGYGVSVLKGGLTVKF
jgi:hypothetical protein